MYSNNRHSTVGKVVLIFVTKSKMKGFCAQMYTFINQGDHSSVLELCSLFQPHLGGTIGP